MADLFDIEGTIRQELRAALAFENLQRVQQQQNGAIVDRQRRGGNFAPRRFNWPAFEKGKPIGVEYRAAQRWHTQGIVPDAAIDHSEH